MILLKNWKYKSRRKRKECLNHIFQKDSKKISIKKSGPERIKINQEPLEAKYQDHKLKGNRIGHRECHIEPDWLMIYKIEDDKIFFERTGSHSELF